MNEVQTLVGKRITECRKRVGVTQTELAEKLGKSLRTVQKYESGEIDMPLSILSSIAETLKAPLNYLVGYDSKHIRLETLSDVLAYLFELDRKKEIAFDVDVQKSDLEDWKCSLIFDGKNTDAKYNADLCLVMETFRDNREALATYWMGYETYDAWEDKTVDYHKNSFITNKEREILDSITLIKKRNELDRLKLEKMLAEQAKKNVDNE